MCTLIRGKEDGVALSIDLIICFGLDCLKYLEVKME